MPGVLSFAWPDHHTEQKGDTIHFTVITRCPAAPHTVIWYGIVDGGDLRFEGAWTTRRWYWTNKIDVVDEGSAHPLSEAVADT